jgi:GNAT superfamily N-acetyltransferase
MIGIRIMSGRDVSAGMRLKEQAGWNQTEADWQRCLELQPDGCFVAECDRIAVGTATTCIFGSIAWVAMVLVDVSVRGRGIGRALLEHALGFLEGRDVRSIRLDATPLGRPLYQKLGFVNEYALARYDGIAHASQIPVVGRDQPCLSPVQPEDLDSLCRFDRDITSTDRSKLLGRLFDEQTGDWRMAVADGKVAGFVAGRPGSLARHIGPCLATAGAGAQLLNDALVRHRGQRVFVDVPVNHTAANAVVRTAGLEPQRTLYRMCRGPRLREIPERIWAAFGPEKG